MVLTCGKRGERPPSARWQFWRKDVVQSLHVALLRPEVSKVVPETNSSHLEMDGWNTILSFWGPAYFQGLWLFVSGNVTNFCLHRAPCSTSAIWARDVSRHREMCRGPIGLGKRHVHQLWLPGFVCHRMIYNGTRLKGQVLYIHSSIESRHSPIIHRKRLIDGRRDGLRDG